MTELIEAYWQLGVNISATSNMSVDDAPHFDAIEPESSAPGHYAVVDVPRESGEYIL